MPQIMGQESETEAREVMICLWLMSGLVSGI